MSDDSSRDHAAIRELLAGYALALDAGDVDECLEFARVRSQVLFVNATSVQLRSALYDDELVRQDGRWRFQRRRCRFITSGGLSDSPEVPSL